MVIEQVLPPTISKKKTSMESRMVMDLRVRTSAKVLAVHPMILIRPKEEKKRMQLLLKLRINIKLIEE